VSVPPDTGSIVLGWLGKLALTLVLLGVGAYDGVALVAASFSSSDRANQYASEAADTYKLTKDIDKAYKQVATEAVDKGDSIDIKGFTVTPDGKCHLTLHHTAKTLWMHRIGFLAKYTHVTSKGEGSAFT
jgi:hypothetical protein